MLRDRTQCPTVRLQPVSSMHPLQNCLSERDLTSSISPSRIPLANSETASTDTGRTRTQTTRLEKGSTLSRASRSTSVPVRSPKLTKLELEIVRFCFTQIVDHVREGQALSPGHKRSMSHFKKHDLPNVSLGRNKHDQLALESSKGFGVQPKYGY